MDCTTPSQNVHVSLCFSHSSLYTKHWFGEEAPNQERSLSRVIALAHESVSVSFVEFVFLLVIWFSSSLFFQPPHLPITYPHPIPHLSCSLPHPQPFIFLRFLESEVLWGEREEWFGEFMWVIYFFVLLFYYICFISTITLLVISTKCFRNMLYLFKFSGFPPTQSAPQTGNGEHLEHFQWNYKVLPILGKKIGSLQAADWQSSIKVNNACPHRAVFQNLLCILTT